MQIEKRLEEVHKYYRQEFDTMSEGFLREIQELKDERRRYATDSGSAVAMVRRECDLDLEKNAKTVRYYK